MRRTRAVSVFHAARNRAFREAPKVPHRAGKPAEGYCAPMRANWLAKQGSTIGRMRGASRIEAGTEQGPVQSEKQTAATDANAAIRSGDPCRRFADDGISHATLSSSPSRLAPHFWQG